MISDICVVPTYQRDELLYLCLEAIRADDQDVRICVFADRAWWNDDLARMRFKFDAAVIIADRHESYGNSRNAITALGFGASQSRRVFLIEDDVIVHRGYFEWMRKQIPSPRRCCACGRIGSPHIKNWYESPSATWDSDYLKVVLRDIPDEYFAPTREEMQKVLDTKMFPNSRYKHGGAEQDGLFLRAIDRAGWETIFPPEPLAHHLGSWGYNRPNGPKPEGTFSERVEWYRNLLGDYRRRVELFGKRITDAEMRVAK